MRVFAFALCFALLNGLTQAQIGRSESPCDTLVFGHHYTKCIKNFVGRTVAFGNRNGTGEKHGWWCELNGNGDERTEGQYVNGLPVGEWWVGSSDIWRYDDHGNILSKGKASRSKKTF